MIKAGVFDVGGVLHTDELKHVWDDITSTLQISLEEFNKAKANPIKKFETGKISEDEFWKEVILNSNAKGILPKESLYGREFIKRFTKNVDTLALVSQLKNKGLKLAVLSNTIDPHQSYAEKEGLFDSFDVKIFSNKVGIVKPSKEIYLLALDELEVRPEEAFYVDDIQENVDAANTIGIHGILFKNVSDLKNRLINLGLNLN